MNEGSAQKLRDLYTRSNTLSKQVSILSVNWLSGLKVACLAAMALITISGLTMSQFKPTAQASEKGSIDLNYHCLLSDHVTPCEENSNTSKTDFSVKIELDNKTGSEVNAKLVIEYDSTKLDLATDNNLRNSTTQQTIGLTKTNGSISNKDIVKLSVGKNWFYLWAKNKTDSKTTVLSKATIFWNQNNLQYHSNTSCFNYLIGGIGGSNTCEVKVVAEVSKNAQPNEVKVEDKASSSSSSSTSSKKEELKVEVKKVEVIAQVSSSSTSQLPITPSPTPITTPIAPQPTPVTPTPSPTPVKPTPVPPTPTPTPTPPAPVTVRPSPNLTSSLECHTVNDYSFNGCANQGIVPGTSFTYVLNIKNNLNQSESNLTVKTTTENGVVINEAFNCSNTSVNYTLTGGNISIPKINSNESLWVCMSAKAVNPTATKLTKATTNTYISGNLITSTYIQFLLSLNGVLWF
jgi:hypothetical protein